MTYPHHMKKLVGVAGLGSRLIVNFYFNWKHEVYGKAR